MNIIQNIVEPEELLLVWKAPLEPEKRRSNLAVGKIRNTRNGGELTYLQDSKDFQDAEQQGFHGYPAFALTRQLHSEVMRTFLRRLPPRNRSDFSDFLKFYRLPIDGDISDFALLANTGGKLPRDWFSVVPDLKSINPPCELLIEVAGFRHQDCFKVGIIPQSGDEAHFRLEPTNPHDPSAIQIFSGEHPIGYVNRLQTGGIKKWLDSGKVVKANIDRINGIQERPIIYLFIEVA